MVQTFIVANMTHLFFIFLAYSHKKTHEGGRIDQLFCNANKVVYSSRLNTLKFTLDSVQMNEDDHQVGLHDFSTPWSKHTEKIYLWRALNSEQCMESGSGLVFVDSQLNCQTKFLKSKTRLRKWKCYSSCNERTPYYQHMALCVCQLMKSEGILQLGLWFPLAGWMRNFYAGIFDHVTNLTLLRISRTPAVSHSTVIIR